MNIFIGGPLEGQKIDINRVNGHRFCVRNKIDKKKTIYRKESFVKRGKMYVFWVANDLTVEGILQRINQYLTQTL